MLKVKTLGLIFLSLILGACNLIVKSGELKPESPEIEDSPRLAYETLDNFLL